MNRVQRKASQSLKRKKSPSVGISKFLYISSSAVKIELGICAFECLREVYLHENGHCRNLSTESKYSNISDNVNRELSSGKKRLLQSA